MKTEALMREIPSILPQTIAIRRHVHMHPELSGEERETAAYICDILSQNGIRHTILPDRCGIVAEVGDGEQAVGIRAEMDALPMCEETGLAYASVHDGIMHACGHDIHLAVALGLFLLLKPHEQELTKRVRIFFQPAEETVGGADAMIQRGCLTNPKVDTVFGFHVDPTLHIGEVRYLPGAMNAAVTDFELTVHGKSCHGAHPEQGIDAIVAAAGLVNALQSIPSRRFAPTTPVIVTVGTISGGTASNIVAGEVRMSGTLRALDMDVMRQLKHIFKQTCENIARGYGAEADVSFTTEYPVLNSSPALTEQTMDRVRARIGATHVHKLDAPSLGADDFAFFCEAADCCYFNIGCRGDEQGEEQILHTPILAPDEGCIQNALEILLEIVT